MVFTLSVHPIDQDISVIHNDLKSCKEGKSYILLTNKEDDTEHMIKIQYNKFLQEEYTRLYIESLSIDELFNVTTTNQLYNLVILKFNISINSIIEGKNETYFKAIKKLIADGRFMYIQSPLEDFNYEIDSNDSHETDSKSEEYVEQSDLDDEQRWINSYATMYNCIMKEKYLQEFLRGICDSIKELDMTTICNKLFNNDEFKLLLMHISNDKKNHSVSLLLDQLNLYVLYLTKDKLVDSRLLYALTLVSDTTKSNEYMLDWMIKYFKMVMSKEGISEDKSREELLDLIYNSEEFREKYKEELEKFKNGL